MAMEAIYFKEREGILHNPVGSATPWWTAFGTQPFLGDSLRQSNGSFGERSDSGDHFTASKQAAEEQVPDKGITTHFTISPGDKNSGEGQKSQAAIATLPDYCNRFELGFGQPMVCAKYPYVDPCYGVFSPHGPQLAGRIMLPLDLGADDGPIFVNPKQYHGIIRRRKSRAKVELLNRATRARKQAYMHESRHLHAMRRPRGSGGRFLNTKNMPNNAKGANPNKDHGALLLPQPTGSQSSEVLQSDDSGSGSSSKETNGGGGGGALNLSGTEVTSIFSMNHHHLQPSIHFLTRMMDAGHNIIMPSKWVAAAAPDSCCNLKV